MTETATAPAVPLAGQPDATVVDRWRGAAEMFAGCVAVRTPDSTLSYAELVGLVWTVASRLRRYGAGRGDLIALSVARSARAVVVALAALEIGAAVVPMDLRQARGRGLRALAELHPALVVADPDDVAGHPRAVPVTELVPDADDARSAPPPVRSTAAELAYVAHTSGTSGRPKAVPVPHAALANRIAWAQECYPIGPGDTVLHASSPVFDFSFWELLAPLCFGAAVAVAPAGVEAEPPQLAEFMLGSGVTVAHFVPSLLREFLDATGPAALRRLRYLLCGGERLSPDLARRLLLVTGGRVFNQYGPVEACIDVLAGELSRSEVDSVPIGRPISGATAAVLDPAGLPVADGEPGVLHVGGACLAWGYRGMGGRTAAEFVPDVTSGVPGARLYRTGDVVRRRPDGLFEYLGRVDDQVKIHGVRVDPSEVEDALLRHPAVTKVSVTVSDGGGVPELIAHLVCAGDGPDDAELRVLLADQVVPAAVPAHYVRHLDLPKLPSGKTDRAGLASLGLADPRPDDTVPSEPATETERRVVEIWSNVLGVDVSRMSDFFALGGQSLLAMRMVVRVRRIFGVPVPARAIFDAPTVQRFAALLDELRSPD